MESKDPLIDKNEGPKKDLKESDYDGLIKEIEQAVNRHSLERGSDTPDFILAEYLIGCLRAFDKAVKRRDIFQQW